MCPGTGGSPGKRVFYLFKFDPPNVPEMNGTHLNLGGTRQDFDTQTGEPIVLLDFTKKGADKFEKITRAEAQRGQLLFNTVGGGQSGSEDAFFQHFAIVLDREIKSFPSIDFKQYPGGIGGSGGAQITGMANLGEAKDLALVLQTGALPVEFRTLDQTAISATLGKDSLNEAKRAALFGLLAVALLLLIVYRFLGLVAVIGLGIYAAFLYAAILLFNVTLTLPGIAGLVLTLGVAADANVVIFERIKEEVRAGRSVRAAIGTGYTKGFHTIIDANVVTMITALVLFAVATASVRGFALMLLVGTAISMLTAVLATRALLATLAGFKIFDNPKFVGATGRGIPEWLKIDYIGKRRLWFAISGAVVVLSLGAVAVNGLNLGIDFRGGSQLAFSTPQPTSLEAVRAQAAKVGQAGARIQGRGSSAGDKYSQFQIQTETLTAEQTASFQRALANGVQAESFGAKNVSASFGRQIARSAILAIIVSLLLIVGYITIRFQWQFAVPVIVALAHDIIITVGVYALLGRECHDGHGRRRAHRARVLDLRHDHHLRPHPREHPADEARLVQDAGQRVALGDDPPLACDHADHAAPDHLAPRVRWRHAQGLRLRAVDRHRVGRILVDLHRRAAARGLQGARARVRPPPRRRHDRRRTTDGRWRRPRHSTRGGGRCRRPTYRAAGRAAAGQ